jgi:LysM repeat protein
MLRPRSRIGRRVLLLVPALLTVIASGCGDDDDGDSNDTVTVGIDGTGVEGVATDADESGDEDEPEDTRDYPSLADVGRADFTHTIVAGDFLRSIAETYDVEIDDIVGANEWDDGRDHLLLPGQEIYLPADAVMPATTEAPDGDDDDGAAVPDDASADPSTVCNSGELTDSYEHLDAGDDTIEDVAAQIGVPADALHRVNDPFPRPPDMPWIIGVPCVDNWPERVSFWDIIDGPVCPDGSHKGSYEVADGDTAEAIAARFGVTIEELVAENEVPEDVTAPQAGDTIAVCESWF